MLVFPNCKVNLGLHVTEKRPDGFHNIETVFYPVDWCDALEVIENKGNQAFEFSHSGLPIEGSLETNLIYKAWQLLKQQVAMPNIKVHLHKNIPMGAGLGGGSADAAFFVKLLNTQFNLNLSNASLIKTVSELGSDCAFFIHNSAVMATGKGNEFSDIKVNLDNYYIALVFPNVHSNTKEAYSGLTPKQPCHKLKHILEEVPVANWKDVLVNDFEVSIFNKYPQVKLLKENLYHAGAVYASMSGSGSAVFGIFENEPVLNLNSDFSYCLQKPKSTIL